jgi:hypothetical protein
MRARALPWRPIAATVGALAVVALCVVAALVEGADGPAPAAAPVAAAPQLPETAPAPAPAAAPAAPARAADPEEALTEELRALVDEHPQAALALADRADQTFPSGRLADERDWLRVRAIVNLGDIGKARTVAGEFFERHPQSPYGVQVWRLTGMSPRRSGPPT